MAQVIAAADFRGELEPIRLRSRDRAALAELARERDLAAAEAAVEELAKDYRYKRDLTTAEECERWLAGRGVSLDDFQEYCLRAYWERQLIDEGAKRNAAGAMDSGEFKLWFQVDLLLSDEFDRLARQLAWRVALDCELGQKEPGHKPSTAARSSAGALNEQNEVEAHERDWLPVLQRMETAFQTRCRELLTLENRRRCLANLRLPLTQFELELLELDGELAAREAYLCVKQDGMSLAQVAAEAGYALNSSSALLENLPADWQLVLLSAPLGMVLPLLGDGEERYLCLVKDKQDASLEHPEVQARVDTTILRQHFLELEARHVRWHILVETSA